MANFEIVEVLPGGQVARMPNLGQFPDGKSAAAFIPNLIARHPGKKFQPRPVAEVKSWRERELARFESGEYQPLPWGDKLELIPDHFAHRSTKTKENIAYTPDEESGARDRQVSIHVNTYLNRFYPGLEVERRRQLVREYTGFDPAQFLKFAESADEIVSVYENGPGSCMSYDEGSFPCCVHPARAYWGHGLTIAYLDKPDGITARCVVHLERKIHARCYGDTEELKEALQSMGYREGLYRHDWVGVKLSTRYVEGYDEEDECDVEGYLAPYVDFASCADLDSEASTLTVTLCGAYEIQSTRGVANEKYGYGDNCPICKTSKYGSFYAYHDDEGHRYACEDCTVAKYGYCPESGVTFHRDYPGVLDVHGVRISPSYARQCTVTGAYYRYSECIRGSGYSYITPPEHEKTKKAA